MTRPTVFKSGLAIVLGQLVKIPLQIISLTLLSRILDSRDFGVIAFCAVFIALGDIVRDLGLSTALLQQEKYSTADASNAFWISTGIGVGLVAMATLAGPIISLTMNDITYSALLPAMSLGLLINAMQAQFQISLARSERFQYIAVTELVAQVVAVGLAIFLANLGWHYWALAWQSVALPLLVLVLRLGGTKWRPGRFSRHEGSLNSVRQGSKHSLVQLLSFGANNADTVAIGAFQGASILGFYSRAFQLYNLPKLNLVDTLMQLVVSRALSLKNLNGSVFEFIRSVQFLLGIILAAIYAFLAGSASLLIPMLLGSNWQASVAVLPILCFAGLFVVPDSAVHWSFVVANRNTELLKNRLLIQPFKILLLVCAAPFGIVAVAVAFAIGALLTWPLNLIVLAKATKENYWPYFSDMATILASGLFAALAVNFTLRYVTVFSDLGNLLICLAVSPLAVTVPVCINLSTRARLVGLAGQLGKIVLS